MKKKPPKAPPLRSNHAGRLEKLSIYRQSHLHGSPYSSPSCAANKMKGNSAADCWRIWHTVACVFRLPPPPAPAEWNVFCFLRSMRLALAGETHYDLPSQLTCAYEAGRTIHNIIPNPHWHRSVCTASRPVSVLSLAVCVCCANVYIVVKYKFAGILGCGTRWRRQQAASLVYSCLSFVVLNLTNSRVRHLFSRHILQTQAPTTRRALI